ncbi:MAG: hypothetical protein JWN25_1034 [Verrucomicrobiales bacterium]|nr:hypothetical protein [Verrucomicrobiales bacterium]
MSIATRTGDNGTTGMMYNRRVAKTDSRVEAYGTVDELNAFLGSARAHAEIPFLRDTILWIQKELVILMGELATQPEDLPRYQKDGFLVVGTAMTSRLDLLVKELESRKISFKGWATPGDTKEAAALDVARTVCRRAERMICHLHHQGSLQNQEIIIYLNRLSDSLWLMARYAETFALNPPAP